MSYRYQPLPHGKFIRLLQLLPGRRNTPIRCRVFEMNLLQPQKYEALSYVWGDVSRTVEITCDGATLSITANLFEALERIRSATEEKALWADAICINQTDLDERSHQVELMRFVYEHAQRVLIWLGPDRHCDAEDAFTLIKDTNEHYGTEMVRHGGIFHVPAPDAGHFLRDSSKWDAAERLFALDWFRRVWVQQEIGVAATALAMYGDLAIPWSEIIEFIMLRASNAGLGSVRSTLSVGSIADAFTLIWETYDTIRSWKTEMPFIRSLIQKSGDASMQQLDNVAGRRSSVNHFINVLVAGSALKATDPKDFIYAFLGHPSAQIASGTSTFVAVDYKKQFTEVYRDVAEKLILQTQSLLPLSLVRHTQETLDAGCPSWVPRWDLNMFCAILAPLPGFDRFYDATQDLVNFRTSRDTAMKFEIRGRNLLVKGLTFDTIVDHSEALQYDDFVTPTGSYVNGNLHTNPVEYIWRDILEKSRNGPCPYEKRLQAYSLALSAGVFRGKLPAEDYLHEQQACFKAHLQQNCAIPACALDELESTPLDVGEPALFARVAARHCSNRKFFITAKGYFGIGPHIIQKGDICALFFGARVPFVLRKTGLDQQALLGECYIQGIMRGEGVSMCKRGGLAVEMFQM